LLALACDLVVAAESAYFLVRFMNIGLVPDGGSSLLVPSRVEAGSECLPTAV
jgi:2-(1,2-epoxy-1,2-dihydrophenyl)acetyl-CoA isomerase